MLLTEIKELENIFVEKDISTLSFDAWLKLMNVFRHCVDVFNTFQITQSGLPICFNTGKETIKSLQPLCFDWVSRGFGVHTNKIIFESDLFISLIDINPESYSICPNISSS